MSRQAAFVLSLFASVALVTALAAQQPVTDGAKYASSGELLRPTDYRDWAFVTSGLGMTYGPAGQDGHVMFDNVFVNRESYRQFMASGKWPEKTMFVLELRGAEEHVSINNGGQTQGGLMAIEASVKDSARFPDTTWAYFDMGAGSRPSAAPLPASAACYACHKSKTAVEWTFVQFYPTLFEVARRMGTVKPTYDPAQKP